jgi:hypothetical protein
MPSPVSAASSPAQALCRCIGAFEIDWLGSAKSNGMRARLEALEVDWFRSAQSGGRRARLGALEIELIPLSPAPEPKQASPTPANGGPFDAASPGIVLPLQRPRLPLCPVVAPPCVADPQPPGSPKPCRPRTTRTPISSLPPAAAVLRCPQCPVMALTSCTLEFKSERHVQAKYEFELI